MLRLLSRAFLLTLTLPLAAQTVQSYQTTSDLKQAMAPQPTTKFRGKPASAPITIHVDDTSRFQTIDGFGASITDGAAWLLQEKLSPAARDATMAKLFDPKTGVGLSFLRQPIGSTDLSRSHSSFDDMPAGQQDPNLEHFSTSHDERDVFPLLKQALHLNPRITIMLTPWSAPAWMKSKDSMDGGQLRPDAEPAFAAYLTRSVQAYEAAGIPVKFLTIQNEPLYETKDYPGTLLHSDQAARIIGEYLGPDLRKAGLNTMLLAYDHNWDHPEYPLAVLADPKAAPFVAGSAMHCYGGDVSAQNAIHAAHPDKGIWLTECSGGTWDKEPALMKTGRLVIDSTRDWAKSVVLWGLALDTDHNPHDGGCATCRPLVEINLKAAAPTVSYTGDFYALAQASRFVRPGATRIASDSFGPQGLDTVAFQNTDGSIALLLLNGGSSTSTFNVQWHGKTFAASIPSLAVATYTWNPR